MGDNMTLNEYLEKNISNIVMISLSVDDGQFFQYNYWNFLGKENQLHLLKDDYCIGHILHTDSIKINDDGSIIHISRYFPKKSLINFYFGGAKLN
jgi:hypothetical protein